jgi:hypothetical protein
LKIDSANNGHNAITNGDLSSWDNATELGFGIALPEVPSVHCAQISLLKSPDAIK